MRGCAAVNRMIQYFSSRSAEAEGAGGAGGIHQAPRVKVCGKINDGTAGGSTWLKSNDGLTIVPLVVKF